VCPFPGERNRGSGGALIRHVSGREDIMKGLILWVMGVPIVVIVLLYLFVF
jgi:hypothetical protein